MPAFMTAGEQAAYQVGVQGLRPELIRLTRATKVPTITDRVYSITVSKSRLWQMIASNWEQIDDWKKAGLPHDSDSG